MQTLLDAGRGIWIVCALTGIFSLPLLRRSRTPAGELAARALLIYTMAVPLAAAADLLNWATALCLCGASIAVTGRIAGPTVWLRSMATANPPQWRRTLTRRVRNLLVERRVHVTGSLALLSATAPFVQSVLNTRLPSEEYALLERTYLLMSGTGLNIRLPTSSLVALASIISAADPLQVVRFLKPILHVTCAVAVEALVRRATAQRSLAYLTAALTGFALVDVQSSVDLFALTMLLTGLAILVHPRRQRFNVTGACGVLTMCVLAMPPVGIFAASSVAAIIGLPRRHVSEGLGIVLLAAAVAEPHLFSGATSFAWAFVAVGTALAGRQLLRRLVRSLVCERPIVRVFRLALITAAVFLSSAPAGSRAQYLESDSSARQVLALKESMSRSRWMLVGTPSQRIQVGPTAFVMDLQEFVTRYRTAAGTRGFRFEVPGRTDVRLCREANRHPATHRSGAAGHRAGAGGVSHSAAARRAPACGS